jgi:hypothetical protein
MSLKIFLHVFIKKAQENKVSKLLLIAYNIATISSSLIGLILIKWQGRLMAVSLDEAFGSWGASQLVRSYHSYQVSQMSEIINDQFITRLNNVVTTIEPLILDNSQSKSKHILGFACPLADSYFDYCLNLKFSTSSVIFLADLCMTGGTQLSTLLSIGRHEFGPYRDIELQTRLNCATQLCREFNLQQSQDLESEIC